MPHAFGEGGTVLMAGRKYDLDKVIAAAEQVADILSLRLDGGKATLAADRADSKEIPWPAPGKEIARDFWLQASTLYDGVYEALVILAGPVRVRWYALGRASVLYDGARDMIVGGDGKEIVSMDPEPCMVVYGEPNRNLIAAVDEAVRGSCDRLGLELWLAEPGPMMSDIRIEGHVALLRFPHERFGDGAGQVRIRCEPAGRQER